MSRLSKKLSTQLAEERRHEQVVADPRAHRVDEHRRTPVLRERGDRRGRQPGIVERRLDVWRRLLLQHRYDPRRTLAANDAL
jgi:hypothetical protein